MAIRILLLKFFNCILRILLIAYADQFIHWSGSLIIVHSYKTQNAVNAVHFAFIILCKYFFIRPIVAIISHTKGALTTNY